MDLWVVDRETGSRLSVLSPRADSGWQQLTVRERLWQADEVEVTLDARVARDAGLLRLVDVDGGQVPAPTLLVAPDTGQVWAVGPFLGSQQLTLGDGRVDTTATIVGWDPCAERRLIDPRPDAHDVQTGAAETVMKNLVRRHLGVDATPARRLPDLTIAADQGRGASKTWRPRFQHLDDYLHAIGLATGVGWASRWDDGVVFDTIHGADLSADVRLEVALGTVRAEEFLRDSDGRVAVAVVAGQGEGAARTVVGVWDGDEPEGWWRSEAWVDARDTDDVDALEARGLSVLGEFGPANVVEVEVDERPGFRYPADFGLGDVLRYRSAWGDDRTVRIVGVTSSWEQATPTRTVALDRPWPDLEERPRTGGTQFE